MYPACFQRVKKGGESLKSFFEKHREIRNWCFNFIGALCYALAINLFLAGNDIAAGGFSGIATVLSSIMPVKISLLIFIMNVPFIILSIWIKGWEFTRNTVIGMAIYSAAVEATSYFPTLTYDPLVAAFFGGVISGIGMACLVLGNGSTGGTELINRLLLNYFPHMSVGKMGLIVDSAVVIFAMVVYKNIEVGLYAIISIYVTSAIADKMLLGFDEGILCMIITQEDPDTIAARITVEFDRTATLVNATGMYSKTDRNVLLSAIKPHQMPKLKQIISETDPAAFVIVMPANEILGEGFKTLAATKRA